MRRPKRATLGHLCPPTGMSEQARHTTRQQRRKQGGCPLIGACILAPGSHCGGNIRGETNQHTRDLTRPGPKARRIFGYIHDGGDDDDDGDGDDGGGGGGDDDDGGGDSDDDADEDDDDDDDGR